jgi:hypothetical protein
MVIIQKPHARCSCHVLYAGTHQQLRPKQIVAHSSRRMVLMHDTQADYEMSSHCGDLCLSSVNEVHWKPGCIAEHTAVSARQSGVRAIKQMNEACWENKNPTLLGNLALATTQITAATAGSTFSMPLTIVGFE